MPRGLKAGARRWVRQAWSLGLLLAFSSVTQAVLNQDCVVNILNRTVQVSALGGWSMPNVPSNMGKVRARATCIEGDQTVSGESDYFNVIVNGLTSVGEIRFGDLDPVPVSLAFTEPGPATLDRIGATYQIILQASFADDSFRDVSAATNGTNYMSTNPAVASVSADGLVTAHSSGRALVTARKDEVVAIKEFVVDVSGDSDGDGLPDDYELANGLNPADPIDAQEDQDGDGLSALAEFERGTSPSNADTDGDGLTDGEELAGTGGFRTDPLLADSDGDGLNDRIELLAGSDPTDPGQRDFAAALDRISVTPASVLMTFNTINSETSSQLAVTGILIDGSTIDLTRKSTGTRYQSSDLSIASFGVTDGQIFGGTAGTATITVSNSGKEFAVAIKVETFQPTALSAIDIPGYANNVDVQGDRAYIAAGAAGLQVVDVSDRTAPKIIASLDTDGTAIDIRVFGNLAYIADGEAGLKIVDISDSAAPVLLSGLDTAGIAQDLKIDGKFAYIADGANGLVIVDISDPAQPVQKSQLGGLGEALGVDAQGNRAVMVAGSSLYTLDVTDPAGPVLAGSIGIGSVKDVVIDGNYAYVAAYSTGFKVVDVSNPSAPTLLGGDASIAPRDVEITDGFAFFAEQLFPNVIAYVNVQDPLQPIFQGVIDLSRLGDYAGTGIAVDGSYAYVTEESYVVSNDYKATGSTRLFIAQYRLINDRGGIAPTVEITKPLPNASVVEGTTITVEASARDDVGVRAVTFSVNDQATLVDSTQPYQVPVAVPFGTKSLKLGASAVDFGNNLASAEVTLHILPDGDRDALADEQEVTLYGTDPANPDSDGDGLLDGAEVTLGTDPLASDTDEDGRTDKAEVDAGTDPLNPDVTAPRVAATEPVADAVDVPENNPVTIDFDEALRASSVTASTVRLLLNGVPVAGSVQLMPNGTQVAFVPSALLQDFTLYTVEVSGVRDRAGNPLATTLRYSYTTGNVVDTTAPRVAESNPANGAAGVPVNSTVSVRLDEPIDPQSVTDATFSVRDSQGTIGGIGTLGIDSRTLTFTPNAALSVGRSHTVTLSGLKDLFGNAMYASFSFTTGYVADAKGPRIVATSIAPNTNEVPTNANLTVAFDEPVSTLRLAGVLLQQGADPVSFTRVLSADHRAVTLRSAQPLDADTTYTIRIADVEDLSGNVLGAPLSVGFRTGAGVDLVAPTVTGVTPANASSEVPLNTQVEARYSERVNPVSVTETSVKLYDGTTGQFVAGTPGLSADGQSVRFVPASPLPANHTYTFYRTYNTYVEDLAGNRSSTSSYFTTGSALQTSAPTVVSSNLADGAREVPVNGRVVLSFDAVLADGCVNAQTVQVRGPDGTAVAGALALGSDRRSVTFTPASVLGVSTAYTVALEGVCDLAGNALSSVTRSFTTSAVGTADTTAPTVTVTPAQGATGVSPTTRIELSFSEAVDVTTLTGGVHVTVSGLSGEVAGELSVTGNEVTFTPSAPLPGSSQISVVVNGVRDLAGNAGGYTGRTFTTGTGTDTTGPSVVSVVPSDKSLDVGPTTPVVLTFSESLNASTVNGNTFVMFVNGEVVRPSVSRSQDNRTVTLTGNWPSSSVVLVIVTKDVKDLSGNALTDYASVFTTSVATDTGRPGVASQFPGSGASGVLGDASIVLYTTEPMNEATLSSALHVAQNGQLVGGTVSVSAQGQAIVFKPLQPWAAGSLVEVFMDNGAQDLSGNALNNYQGSFRVAPDPATTAPRLVGFGPNNASGGLPTNGLIELQFDQLLEESTVSAARVVLRDGSTGAEVARTVSVGKGGQVVRVVPQSALTASHSYYVHLTDGLLDREGQAVPAACCYYLSTAAGADTQAPKVVTMSPPTGSTNVGVNGHVHVQFDEAVNPLSLLGDELRTVYGSLSWQDGNRSVEFVRHQPYAVNSEVTETVSGVEDYAGNAVSAPHSVTFRTGGGPDFVAPQLESGTPYNGATNVPVNAVLKLRFNEALDPVSVNGATSYVYSSQDGVVAGTVSLDTDGRTLVYAPDASLAVSRNYTLYAYGVRDLSGNTQYVTRSFVTSFAADVAAPVVKLTSVFDGQTEVPTNAVLAVVLDEAVNEQRLSGVTLSLNGTPVTSQPTLSADRRSLVLKLAQPLQANAGYVLRVAALEDLSGNVLGAPLSVGFRTGAGVDLVAPTVTGVTPANASSEVPLNTQVEARYSERVNPVSVTETSVKLYDGTTGQFVAGTPGLSADGQSVRFVPASPLPANHTYTFYRTYNTYVEDLAGNRSSTSSYFTTGAQ